MKYFNKITLGLILCTVFLSSCKDDDEPGMDGITVDKTEITVGAIGGIEKIAISANDQWVTRASEPWLAISPANGVGSAVCEVAIDSTLANVARTTEILFSMNGGATQKVAVTQFGFSKQILLKEPEVKILSSATYKERHFKTTISTNVNFRIDEKVDYSFAEAATMTPEEKADAESDRSGWLTLPKEKDLAVDLDRGARPRTINVDFPWGMNVVPYTRVAKIRLVPVNEEDLKDLVDENGNKIDAVVLTVRQEAAMKIEDNRAGDSLAVITINTKLQSMIPIDASESMMNWSNVTLWEATDKEIQDRKLPEEAVGRIRSVTFRIINLQDGESLPREIRHLKYLESFAIKSNENSQIRTISLGEEIGGLAYLKNLTVFAVGINTLPTNFVELGETLEVLDLSGNNFQSLSVITDIVNEENFGKLKSLSLIGCRAMEIKDLSLASGGKYNGRYIGLHADISKGQLQRDAFLKLLTWDHLISLGLSNDFLEGELPTDEEVMAALGVVGKPLTYQSDDFFSKDDLTATPTIYQDKISKDTCQWLLSDDNEVTYQKQKAVVGQDIPRVLPFTRDLRLNLNFLTGKVPNWLLFHPYFAHWNPITFVFNQQESGKNSKGNTVGFSNVELVNYDYSYYYGKEDPGSNQKVDGVAYPLYYKVFVLSGTVE